MNNASKKIRAIELLKEGMSVKDIAERLQCDKSSIYQWKKGVPGIPATNYTKRAKRRVSGPTTLGSAESALEAALLQLTQLREQHLDKAKELEKDAVEHRSEAEKIELKITAIRAV